MTLSVSASRQDLVTAGQAVSIELPDGSSVGGHIREVGRVAATDQQGSTTLPVTIDIDRGAVLPDLDAAPVTVHVVTERHEGVLTVPVNALVALLEGGYAVEVVAPDGSHRYVGVTIGLFQDGRVEVGATGLAEGDAVVVAR